MPAQVVLFDSGRRHRDPVGARARPHRLPFAPQPAQIGDNAIVLGYPGGGPYTASAARVRETLNLKDPTSTQPEPSNARSTPCADRSGRAIPVDPWSTLRVDVLGVVFGAAIDDTDTGFVLTAEEVSAVNSRLAGSVSTPVATGVCISVRRHPARAVVRRSQSPRTKPSS